MPDVAGTRAVYEALRAGGFVLAGPAVGHYDGVATVTVSGDVPAVALVRPDGYVAWAADRPDDGVIRAALRQWCGPVPVPSR